MKYLIQQKIQFDAGEGYLISDNGEMIQLTRTACLLLVTLLTEQGVISRNTLLEKVWDAQGQQGSYSSLNQYLSIIRRSFRQLGLVNIVITVPRKGYQLNPDISVTSVASEGRAENGAILAPELKRVVNEPSEEQRFLLRAHKVTIKNHRLAQSNRFCWKFFFDYKVKQSGKVKEYLLEKIRTVKGVADNATENEFRRVIPAVKQGTEKMMLLIKPLSQDAHVISSINEPLFICAKT